MGVVQYRPVPLLTGNQFAALAVTDNGQPTPEPVEISVVHIHEGTTQPPYRTWLLRPTQPITRYATADHGLIDEQLQDAPTVSDVADDIRTTLADRILIAHRSDQCATLLTTALGQVTTTLLDTRRLSSRVWPSQSRALGELLRLTGLTAPGRLGRAGHDALATALLFLHCTRHIEEAASRSNQEISAAQVIQWATPSADGPAW